MTLSVVTSIAWADLADLDDVVIATYLEVLDDRAAAAGAG